MKKISALFAVISAAFVVPVSAAQITVFYSPSCPHCHHAREFIESTLVYEYPSITVNNVNVMEQDNLPAFREALTKCEFKSGGVPVLVVGEKCFQGYADFMQDEIRQEIESTLSAEEKLAAEKNKKALAEDADKFKSENVPAADTITEVVSEKTVTKQDSGSSNIWFYGLLVALVAALGFVLIRKDNKNK